MFNILCALGLFCLGNSGNFMQCIVVVCAAFLFALACKPFMTERNFRRFWLFLP